MDGFTLGVESLTDERIAKAADDIEQHVGKCLNTEAKWSSINVESLAVLVQLARRCQRKSMPNKLVKVFVFNNGSIAALDENGLQVTEIQVMSVNDMIEKVANELGYKIEEILAPWGSSNERMD